MDYNPRKEFPPYLFQHIFPQLEELLASRGVRSISIKDSSYIKLRRSELPIDKINTMLFNSIVWNTPTSFYQTLFGFRNRDIDQLRLNAAFQSLQRYTYVDFVRDITVLNLSRNRDTF
jgi:hypothetical protein